MINPHRQKIADYPDFLSDESRRNGQADSIAFPPDEAAVCADLAAAHAANECVTLQCARTGITAGAVPAGGHVLNFSRMTRILASDPAGTASVRVQPGVILSELNKTLAVPTDTYPNGLFLPPDPTETSAGIGGMIACNASGARSFLYGPVRPYVRRLRVALADGDLLDLARGRDQAHNRTFELVTLSGRHITGTLPALPAPRVKNAAGYFVHDNMDMLDLFIGAEGTLGAVTEAELALLPRPAAVWGITLFFPDEPTALHFVADIRTQAGKSQTPIATPPQLDTCNAAHLAAVEYFDARALALVSRARATLAAFAELPAPPAQAGGAVYLEYHGTEATVEQAVLTLSESLSTYGSDENTAWVASDPREMERLKKFRHAIPEIVNMTIAERKKQYPNLTKLGTDFAVPAQHLPDIMRMYHDNLRARDLEYVIFGHIGDCHVHVNILPRNPTDYDAGKALYLEWAARVTALGGTVSAEHGIGKLKTALLRTLYGDTGIQAMREIKHTFDPNRLLNRGNLFD